MESNIVTAFLEMDWINMQVFEHGSFIKEMFNSDGIVARSLINVYLGKTTALPHFSGFVRWLVITRAVNVQDASL